LIPHWLFKLKTLYKIGDLADIILKRAEETKYLAAIGRTHGIHAEITTIGLKFLSFYAEIKRDLKRIKRVRGEIAVGKISGAVGNYANLPPEVESLNGKITKSKFIGGNGEYCFVG